MPSMLQQDTSTQEKQLLLIVAHRSYVRDVNLKIKLKDTGKVGVAARRPLATSISISGQYYSECYNRDIQVHNLKN